MKYIGNLRIFSYVYLLLLAIDDNPLALYFALPWIFYLLIDSYKVGFSTNATLIHFGVVLLFMFSLFYNKSESNFYHPMIGKAVVLPHNLYVSKGCIKGILHISNGDFRPQNEKMILLPKGETVKIVSFVRRGSMYDLAIETSLNRQILNQLDPEKVLKGNSQGRLYFWSNNFFDALKMLSNDKVDEYSITSNPYFKILYFLYPFALLCLLLQSLKKRMDVIQTMHGFHPLNFVLYIIAYYYILLASINDGFSGFFLGIPYTLFLLWEIWHLKKKSKIIYLHILILLLAMFLVFSDRSKSQFLYPMVDKTYTIINDVNYSYGSFYINELDIFDRSSSNHRNKTKSIYQLVPGDEFKIERQVVSGNADMGVDYTYQIQSESFSKFHNYIAENLTKIKSELNDDFKKNRNMVKIDFYFDDEKNLYISEHELRTLLKAQNLPYDKHRIESDLIDVSFFILYYLIILILFFLILTFRNRKVFYAKHNKLLDPIKKT